MSGRLAARLIRPCLPLEEAHLGVVAEPPLVGAPCVVVLDAVGGECLHLPVVHLDVQLNRHLQERACVWVVCEVQECSGVEETPSLASRSGLISMVWSRSG